MSSFSNKISYPQREAQIIKLFKIYPYDWAKIKTYFPSIKQKSYCAQIYRNYYKFSPIQSNKIWNNTQDQLLLQLSKKYQFQWKQIAPFFDDCTIKDCYFRCKQLIKLNKNHWQKQEINSLIKLFKEYPYDWKKISYQLKKSDLQVVEKKYERVLNLRIDKNSRRRKWTEQQEDLLQMLCVKQKYQWDSISKFFDCPPSQCYIRHKRLFRQANKKSDQLNNKTNTHKSSQTLSQSPRKLNNQSKSSSAQNSNKNKKPVVQEQNTKTFINSLFAQFPYNWVQISNRIPHCNEQMAQIMFLVFNDLKKNNRERKWFKYEDNTLRWLIQRYGYEWNIFEDYFEDCSGFDCFKRYKQLLDNSGKQINEREAGDSIWNNILEMLKNLILYNQVN